MFEKIKNNNTLLMGTIAAIVFLIFSIIFLISAQSFSDQGSYVEVKGLSEKIVKADVAIWSINFEVKSNVWENIPDIYKQQVKQDSYILQSQPAYVGKTSDDVVSVYYSLTNKPNNILNI